MLGTGWNGKSRRTFGRDRGRTRPSRSAAPVLRVRFRTTSQLLPDPVARGFVSILAPALVVDQARKSCWIRGREHSMHARDSQLALLSCLVRHQGAPVPLDRLHREVWGRPMTSPGLQAGKVYYQLHAVRRLLEESLGLRGGLRGGGDGYALDPDLVCVLVEPGGRSSRRNEPAAIPDRILEEARMHGFVDNRTACRITGMASSTIRHVLGRLVTAGRLRACGGGRSTHYHPPGAPAGCPGGREEGRGGTPPLSGA